MKPPEVRLSLAQAHPQGPPGAYPARAAGDGLPQVGLAQQGPERGDRAPSTLSLTEPVCTCDSYAPSLGGGHVSKALLLLPKGTVHRGQAAWTAPLAAVSPVRGALTVGPQVSFTIERLRKETVWASRGSRRPAERGTGVQPPCLLLAGCGRQVLPLCWVPEAQSSGRPILSSGRGGALKVIPTRGGRRHLDSLNLSLRRDAEGKGQPLTRSPSSSRASILPPSSVRLRNGSLLVIHGFLSYSGEPFPCLLS